MELKEFFDLVRTEIQESIADKLRTGREYPYAEVEFVERFVAHMVESGMTFPNSSICTHQGKSSRRIIKISGYAFSEESDQLDLFVANYEGAEELEEISKPELLATFQKCFCFLTESVNGRLSEILEKSSDVCGLATLIRDSFSMIDQIRIYVITDRISRIKRFMPKIMNEKTVKLEVMDIERLYRHTVAGRPRDEITVNLKELCGRHLQCVYVPKGDADYSYALTVFPGNMIYLLYEKYNALLLEANVRSFLSFNRKINKGIRDTLEYEPEYFMAYNNGLVIIADKMIVENEVDGTFAISWLKGIQIVNGGQTTSSIYFAKKRLPNDIDLTKVFVPVKIICLEKDENKKFSILEEKKEEKMISNISRYANSQNSINKSDLESNQSFHRTLESIFRNLYCPDGISQWFYERTSGSYNTKLALEGTTPARLKALRQNITASRKITKTELAKYYNAWNCKPDIVALGAQKNFVKFMEEIGYLEENGFKPDLKWVKECIVKAIIFKNADRIVFYLNTPSKINVTTYLVSILSKKLNDNKISINFEKIWQNQDISEQLKNVLTQWAPEVYRTMLIQAGDKLLSEWAKKKECWIDVQKGDYKIQNNVVPEFKR